MTLMEHLQELRSRLFKASLAVLLGMIAGWWVSEEVFQFLKQPYCGLALEHWDGDCPGLQQLEPLAAFTLKLKVSLWLGLMLAAPVWFYQIWAFVAPGLHRNERKWTYIFVAIAVPLFVAGALLAYSVLERGLTFVVEYGFQDTDVQLEMTSYITFVSTVMLVFAIGFELPLLILMLNFAGIVSARKLLSWWRVAVFICFVFASFATPDPGPTGMLLLAAVLSGMYFLAVGIAFLNDRRKAKKHPYGNLADDEISTLDDLDPVEDPDPVTAGDPVQASTAIATEPRSPHRRYDDML